MTYLDSLDILVHKIREFGDEIFIVAHFVVAGSKPTLKLFNLSPDTVYFDHSLRPNQGLRNFLILHQIYLVYEIFSQPCRIKAKSLPT